MRRRAHILNLFAGAIIALFVTGCGGCGGGEVPGTGGDSRPGDGCSADADCESGLRCDATGVCVYQRCDDAPDPEAFCAEALGLEATQVECDGGDGSCTQRKVGIGALCTMDAQCDFGLICAEDVCVETCRSSVSCPVAGEACVARASGPEKYCQPSPGCGAFADPTAHCADRLGLRPDLVLCGDDGECVPRALSTGAVCRFDAQCEQEVCEGGLCGVPCEADEDCPRQEICQTRRGGGPTRVCQPGSCDESLRPRIYCQNQLNTEDAYCNGTQGVCEESPPFITGIFMVEDTTGTAACTDSFGEGAAPGVDLWWAGVFARDAEIGGAGIPEQRARARMRHLDLGYGPNGNAFITARPFAAEMPPYMIKPSNGCPPPDIEPHPSAVLSLGCGGRIFFDFIDQDRATVRLTEEDILAFGEIAPVCTEEMPGQSMETAAVYWCSDEDAVLDGDYLSCDTEMPVTFDPMFGGFVAEIQILEEL